MEQKTGVGVSDLPDHVVFCYHQLARQTGPPGLVVRDKEGGVEDLVIAACRWHVEAEAGPYKQRALDHFRERYTVLLDFLRAEGLLADPSVGQDVADWLGFQFRRSHLTDEGYELVRQCHGTRNPAFGQGHTQRHLSMGGVSWLASGAWPELAPPRPHAI